MRLHDYIVLLPRAFHASHASSFWYQLLLSQSLRSCHCMLGKYVSEIGLAFSAFCQGCSVWVRAPSAWKLKSADKASFQSREDRSLSMYVSFSAPLQSQYKMSQHTYSTYERTFCNLYFPSRDQSVPGRRLKKSLWSPFTKHSFDKGRRCRGFSRFSI